MPPKPKVLKPYNTGTKLSNLFDMGADGKPRMKTGVRRTTFNDGTMKEGAFVPKPVVSVNAVAPGSGEVSTFLSRNRERIAPREGVTPMPGMTGPFSGRPITNFNVGEMTPKVSTWNKIADGANRIAPYMSNILNAGVRPPTPIAPQMGGYASARFVSMNDAKNKVMQSSYSTRKGLYRNLDANTAAAASAGVNAQETNQLGQIGESESNTNAGIYNQNQAQNAQISANNAAVQNNYNDDVINRQIADQREKSANRANFGDKYVGIQNEKARTALEIEKLRVLEPMMNEDGVYERLAGKLRAAGMDPSVLGTDPRLRKRARMGGRMRQVFPMGGQLNSIPSFREGGKMEKKGKDTVAVKTNPMREAFDMAMEYAMTPVETPKATPVKTPVVPVKATLPTAKAQPVVTPPQIGKKGSKSNVGNYTPFFTSLGISTPVPTGAVGSKADIQSGLKTNPTVVQPVKGVAYGAATFKPLIKASTTIGKTNAGNAGAQAQTGAPANESQRIENELSEIFAPVKEVRKLYDSYQARQRDKANSDFETKTKFIIPKTTTLTTPSQISGDTIALDKDRYILPMVQDANQVTYGVRNRGDVTPIKTEGLDVTTFQPFTKAADYFKTNKYKDTDSFVGVDAAGKMKLGQAKDFQNTDMSISRVFMNKVQKFNRDANGKIALVQAPKKQDNRYTNPSVEVLDDNGKVVQGSLNVFAGMGTKRTDSYGKVTGGKFMFKSADGKRTQLVSGSIDDIGNAFDSFKGNDKHVEVYTLDNGTYGPGLRYRDQNLTSERLKAYDAANTTGGSGLYVKSIPKTNMTPVTGTKFRSDTALTKNVRTEKDASYLKGHGLTNEQKAIVLHHTANWNVNDALKVMNNNERSSHVVIDVDGRRVVMAKPDQVAFHAGESNYKGRDNVNDFGLGVEFIGDTDKKPLTEKQIDSFVEYATPFIKSGKIKIEDVITHKMITAKDGAHRKPDINDAQYARVLNKLKLALK